MARVWSRRRAADRLPASRSGRTALDLRYLLVLLCFFVSGFAGLLYETAWTREFSFVFGTSNLAVATVLAAYMGGLSLGAAIAARLMHRIRRPVLAYGLLELGIAASALAVPYLIRAVTLLYRPLFLNAGDPARGRAGSPRRCSTARPRS